MNANELMNVLRTANLNVSNLSMTRSKMSRSFDNLNSEMDSELYIDFNDRRIKGTDGCVHYLVRKRAGENSVQVGVWTSRKWVATAIGMEHREECEELSTDVFVSKEDAIKTVEDALAKYVGKYEKRIQDVCECGVRTVAQNDDQALQNLQKFQQAIEDGWPKNLETPVETFSPFDVLRASDHEIRHSNVLGWLMDPKGSHGLMDVFLRNFLNKVNKVISNNELGNLLKDNGCLDCKISRETGRHGTRNNNESGQMDLVLTFEKDKLLLVIENKWNAGEICEGTPGEDDNTRKGQLSRYSAMMDGCRTIDNWKKVYVFLTPRGIRPDSDIDAKTWISIGYDAVLSTLDECVKNVKNESVKAFLEQYRQIIVGKIGNCNEIRCREIYSLHKDALEFIKVWRSYLLRHSRNEALREVCMGGVDAGDIWICSNYMRINKWKGQSSSGALELAEKLYCAHRVAIDNILFNTSEPDLADDRQVYFQYKRRFPSDINNSVHYEIIDYGHGYDALQVCLHVEGRTDAKVKKQAELLVVPFKKNWPTIKYVGREAEDIANDLRGAIKWIYDLFEPALNELQKL